MTYRKSAAFRGFTLVETIMAMASVGVVGLSIFYTLYYGLILFTKNTAMNVSHQQARMALIQLYSDIHSAVSPPSLTDSNGVMISGTSASPGVEFQVMVSSTAYCQVVADVAVGATSIEVGLPSGYPTPYAGMRLIVPTFGIEQDVSAVSISGTVATCTLSGSSPNALTASNGDTICFFTHRVYYYVTGAASGGGSSTNLVLDYLGVQRNQTYMIAANGLINGAPYDPTCATPFSIPSTSTGSPNYRFIQVTGLSTQDPQTTGLSTIFAFNTSSIMLSGLVPEYQTLTTYQ